MAVPRASLEVTKGDKTITVVTGPAKFVIPTAAGSQFGPFEQVYVRAGGLVQGLRRFGREIGRAGQRDAWWPATGSRR